MYLQLAARAEPGSCEAFAVVSGEMTCNPSRVAGLLGKTTLPMEVFSSDYSHCVSDCHLSKESPVIIYGELGSQTLAPFLVESFGAYTILRHYIKVRVCACSRVCVTPPVHQNNALKHSRTYNLVSANGQSADGPV